MLATAGVPLAQTQRLMRHGTPALTARTYLKLRIEDGLEAVGKIDGGSESGRAGAKALAGS